MKRFSFISLLLFLFANTVISAQSGISADTDLITSRFENLNIQKQHSLFDSNNQKQCDVFNHEIKLLKSYYPHSKSINLGTKTSMKLAPQLYLFLFEIVSQLTKKANIEMPEIWLDLKTKTIYNACARITKTIYTTTYKSRYKTKVEKHVETEAQIHINKELLQLYLWQKEHIGNLKAVIAHEIGHIKFGHDKECPKHEHQADCFATTIIDKPLDMINALQMMKVARSIYTQLKNEKSFNTHDCLAIARKIAAQVMRCCKNKTLLEECSSDMYINTVLSLSIKEALENVTNIDSTDYTNLMQEIYSNIIQVCKNHHSYLENHRYTPFEHKCIKKENKLYLQGKQTHPPLFQRQKAIYQWAQRKNLL